MLQFQQQQQGNDPNKKQFLLTNLPKEELKQIRYLFNNGRIPFFKNLLVQLMRRTKELPDNLTKLFGSYIEGEMAPVSWEIFLQVLEEEINRNDLKSGENGVEYGSKTIFLKTPLKKNLSVQPTKFFHPQYSIDFCEFIEVQGFKVTLLVINSSSLAIVDKDFSQLLNSVTFSRDFKKFTQGQLHKRKLMDEQRQKEESMKKLRMSRLSSLMGDSVNEVKENKIDYNFDVILYAGLKKPKKKNRNGGKEKRKSLMMEEVKFQILMKSLLQLLNQSLQKQGPDLEEKVTDRKLEQMILSLKQ